MLFYSDNEIEIDGEKTGLKVAQQKEGTIVYTRGGTVCPMPHKTYSLSHEYPASGIPGLVKFEKDIRAVISRGVFY